MKKLLILSVLLGLMALPMFASDITFGGDATYGFIGDFGDNFAEKKDLTFDIKAAIDDYSSLTVNMDGLERNIADLMAITDLTDSPVDISKALVATDIGMWLGLPVGVVASWGYDDPDANEFHSISGYGNEEVFDFSPAEYWGHAFLVSASFAEVEFAFDPGLASADFGRLLVGLAVKEPIPGLNAEVYYFQNEVVDDFALGQIGFDAAYAGDFGGFGVEAGAGFMYDLDDAAANAWAFGVGLSGAYSIATFTVGVDGNETDVLNQFSGTAEIAAVDMATIYAGLLYDAANSELNEVDLGVNAHIGAVEAYVGYVVTSVGGGSGYNAPAAIPDGGAYIKFDVDY